MTSFPESLPSTPSHLSPCPILTVQEVSLTFPNGHSKLQENGLEALEGVSFAIYPREFVCVLGPSGSGKSTLLRILAGLLKPSKGAVIFSGEHPARIGMVFQQANLMPWRTVLENVTLPLELQGLDLQTARQRAEAMIALVGLHGFEDAWPRDLSGGMAQRVAIARALVHDPDLLLLDEPFGSLDALTRERMWDELLRIWQEQQKTVLMVTHSVSEALFLADRVLVLTQRPGKIRLDLSIPLPRPRRDEVRYTELFGTLARQLKEAIG